MPHTDYLQPRPYIKKTAGGNLLGSCGYIAKLKGPISRGYAMSTSSPGPHELPCIDKFTCTQLKARFRQLGLPVPRIGGRDFLLRRLKKLTDVAMYDSGAEESEIESGGSEAEMFEVPKLPAERDPECDETMVTVQAEADKQHSFRRENSCGQSSV